MNPEITKYRQDKAFVLGLSISDAGKLMKHGNPVIRRAAVTIAQMAEEHRRGNYLPAMDSRFADDILSITEADAIRAALS